MFNYLVYKNIPYMQIVIPLWNNDTKKAGMPSIFLYKIWPVT